MTEPEGLLLLRLLYEARKECVARLAALEAGIADLEGPEKKVAVAKGRRGHTRSKVAAVKGAASRSSKAAK